MHLKREESQHNEKIQELMANYQNSIAHNESNSFENYENKSFRNCYKRIQLEQFKEMQAYLRDLVKKESLRKIVNPCLMFKELDVKGNFPDGRLFA